MRQHVEGFLASAEQYAQITELSKRVHEWEDKILPKLREEVRQISSTFNIFNAIKILSKQKKNIYNTKSFKMVVNDSPKILKWRFLISISRHFHKFNL